MRLTTHRKTVLDVLKNAKKPLNAELIYGLLPKGTMNLSTIYRSLDTLYANHYIAKTMLNQTAYYHVNEGKHHHYMICLSCHKMIEVDCHLKENIYNLAETGFEVISHDLTFYGYCSNCKNKEIRN